MSIINALIQFMTPKRSSNFRRCFTLLSSDCKKTCNILGPCHQCSTFGPLGKGAEKQFLEPLERRWYIDVERRWYICCFGRCMPHYTSYTLPTRWFVSSVFTEYRIKTNSIGYRYMSRTGSTRWFTDSWSILTFLVTTLSGFRTVTARSDSTA
jgi:hypothetical protein